MNSGCRLLIVCSVLSASCIGQITRASLTERLQQAQAESQALYAKGEFGRAAAVLQEVLKSEPAVALLPDWPDAMYNLACDQARAGQREGAQITLQEAVDLGANVSSEQLAQDPDLQSLHSEQTFQKLVAALKSREAIWKESASIATQYKPVLGEDEKVAGLSKFWSETRFNFPFFNRQPDLDWDALYVTYLSRVREAQTTAAYYRVMMRFSAELKDGHTNVYPPPQLFNALYASPGLRTALVEGAVVVTQVLDPSLVTAGWKVGDIILKIGDVDVRTYAETNVAPYVSSSTPQDRDVRTFNYSLLAGDVTDPLVLTVESAAGSHQVRTVKRLTTDVVGPMFRIAPSDFKVLHGDIAYVAVNEFEDDAGVKTILEHFPQIQSAKGLILDLRHNGGGNSQNGVSILQMLAGAPLRWEAEQTPEYRAVNRAWGLAQHPAALPQPYFQPDTQHHLSLPVVVLTSAETFSAAEDFVALFDSMHRGRIIGQSTAGSTGQPFSFKLPGGGSARICTKDTRTPDGRIYMGVGIPPDILVKPSLADVRHGRDAAVDKALESFQMGSS